MRRKLAGNGGLTLVEMLAAVAVLVLLGLVLSAGMQMAMNSYHDMVAQSETELLLSTLADTLADDLRYADDVVETGGTLSYYSDSYGAKTTLGVNSGGQVIAKSGGGGGAELRVLPDGAYGKGRYVVDKDKFEITYTDGIFTLNLSVKEKDGTIGASTELSVRCLNPEEKESEP